MSTYSIRQRWGMGPRVDPHFDARVGRIAATLQGSRASDPAEASGYIELDGDKPWEYLEAMLGALYRRTPLPAGSAGTQAQHPLVWTQLKEIRYLTTERERGIALPMHAFMPPEDPQADREVALQAAIVRLEAATGGRLRDAQRIGLTVVFDFTVMAQTLQPVFSPGPLDRLLGGTRVRWASENVDHVLGGGTRPASPLRTMLGARAGDRPFRAQKLGLAGYARAQLASAMRCFQPPPAPEDRLDYGIQQTGSGTIVGIVDFGCDFAHPSFRKGDNGKQSRILALWDQNAKPKGTSPSFQFGGQDCSFGYGRLITRDDIEKALEKADPYTELKYDPHKNHYTATPPGGDGEPYGAHGTFVMEVAAGGRRSVGIPGATTVDMRPRGVAPDADIVFVQVGLGQGNRVVDMNDVVDAIAFIFHVADREERPCVVNLSLNTMSGPHDGDGYFERRLACLLRSGRAGSEVRGRAVVIAAGNLPESGAQRKRWQHLADDVSAGSGFSFHWRMAAKDATLNTVEIWYDATDAWLQVTLVSPEGETIGPVKPGRAAELMVGNAWRGAIIGSRLMPELGTDTGKGKEDGEGNDAAPGRQVILLQVQPESETSVQWKVLVEIAPDTQPPPAAGKGVHFDAWLERDDDGPSGLSRHNPPHAIDDNDRVCTVGTLSCGDDAIVVGAYDTFNGVAEPWALSGRGPSRRQDIFKPDIAAPGNFLWLVRSCRGNGQPDCLARISGTSVAAPFVTGTIACIYQLKPDATLKEVKEALMETALQLPNASLPQPNKPAPKPIPQNWSLDAGYGRLNPPGVLSRFQ